VIRCDDDDTGIHCPTATKESGCYIRRLIRVMHVCFIIPTLLEHYSDDGVKGVTSLSLGVVW